MVAIRLRGPAASAERTIAACWESGTLGLEEDLAAPSPAFRMTAYFPSREAATGLRRALRGLGVSSQTADVPDVDWIARFREGFVGVDAPPFAIRPTWRPEVPRERIPLLVDPARAFGTGTHETTRLCLAAIGRLGRAGLAGRRIVDLGAGTGILAIACLLLGARQALAIELDAEAVADARRHARLNHVSLDLVRADLARGLRPGAADLVLANLEARLLERRADEIARSVAPGGRLVLSGLLAVEADSIAARYAAFGSPRVELLGEWAAVEVSA